MVGNLHRFISEISVGDVVVTVEGAHVYVGEISGAPKYTGDVLVTRQRPVAWVNAGSPFTRSELSSNAADGLRGQLTVSELTAHLAEFATLGELKDVTDLPTPDVAPGGTVAVLGGLRPRLDQEGKGLVEPLGGEYEVVQFHPSYSYEDFFEGPGRRRCCLSTAPTPDTSCRCQVARRARMALLVEHFHGFR